MNTLRVCVSVLNKFYKINQAHVLILCLKKKKQQLLHTLFSAWKLRKLCYEISRGSRLQAHLANTKNTLHPGCSKSRNKQKDVGRHTHAHTHASSSANNKDKTVPAAAAVVVCFGENLSAPLGSVVL